MMTAFTHFPGLVAVLEDGKLLQSSGSDSTLAETLISQEDAALVNGIPYRIQKEQVGSLTYCYAMRL